MGAWGVGVFENDDAQDFLAEVEQAGSVKPITRLLIEASSSDYLEAPVASASLAAAELVAAAFGRPMSNPPDAAKAVFSKFTKPPPTQIIELAQAVTSRVLSESELSDLWEESGEPDEWRATVAELAGRLRTTN